MLIDYLYIARPGGTPNKQIKIKKKKKDKKISHCRKNRISRESRGRSAEMETGNNYCKMDHSTTRSNATK